VNGQRIEAFDQLITEQDLDDEETIVLRSGKKRFHKIKVQGSGFKGLTANRRTAE
jgi:tyrosyl-tRNA synthetase